LFDLLDQLHDLRRLPPPAAASAAASTINCSPMEVDSESITLIWACGNISVAAMAEFQVPLSLLEMVSTTISSPASASSFKTA
jgi:hypothetical protein